MLSEFPKQLPGYTCMRKEANEVNLLFQPKKNSFPLNVNIGQFSGRSVLLTKPVPPRLLGVEVENALSTRTRPFQLFRWAI